MSPTNDSYQSPCGHICCPNCLEGYIIPKIKLEKSTICFSQSCSYKWDPDSIKVFFSNWGSVMGSLSSSFFPIGSSSNIVTCSGCKEKFYFEAGDQSNSPNENESGRGLTPLHKRIFAEDRFKCIRCNREQCKVCGVSPYHTGYICPEFKELNPCRYCESPLEHEVDYSINPFIDICTVNNECLTKSGFACTTILGCGHRCFGYKNESKHPGCLLPSCDSYQAARSDCCTYCNESLTKAPVVKLRCNDFFHYDCLKECLQRQWCTKRITFGFLMCANCKTQMGLPIDCADLRTFYEPAKELMVKVIQISLNKLKIDGREKDDQLVKPTSRFYQKNQEYAMAIYAIYQCNKCKNPFIGGQVNCEAEANVDPDPNNRETYMCLDCSGGKKCQFHGADAIVYKCRFCCQIATWFCFGTTHFCNPCHEKQCKDASFAKNGPWEVCDKSKCPFNGNHKSPPSDDNLGCSLCGIVRN